MMAKVKITEFRDILLEDLVIGTSQVRLSDTGAEIDELATSISQVGLLQPIMVAPVDAQGKYEIILGQRRFLACKRLQLKTVKAAILSEKVDEITAKIISLTENMMRRNLSAKDCIDVCTDLFKKYSSMKAVSQVTGLPYADVSRYVKYDRLSESLKKLYDDGEVDLKTALDVNDAIGEDGDQGKAVKLALEMNKMAGDQKRRTTKIVSENPDLEVNIAIEEAKKQITHKITFLLGPIQYDALGEYAKGLGQRVEEAAGDLVEEALKSEGYLEDGED